MPKLPPEFPSPNCSGYCSGDLPPTIQRLLDWTADYFEEQDYIEHDYELGERCPILVYAPRSGEVMG